METFAEVLARWRAAEARGDLAVLDAVLDPEFLGDGPGGTVLTKAAWLRLHGQARPVPAAFRFVESESPLAERIGIGFAVATAGDSRAICTVVAVRRPAGWRIVNVQVGVWPPGRSSPRR